MLGSASTTHDTSPCPTSTRRAPRPMIRSTSAAWSSGARSMCRRFLPAFSSGTDRKMMPGRAFSSAAMITSSSSSCTMRQSRTRAQKVASPLRSWASTASR
ncbi:hypothetical protein ADK43_23955 [Streptomyces rimosus subsp. rimosus]|nr:hypothetical protein ADK43_23955 [Streptomyces rimosus subsp. rimosus]